MTAPNRVLAAAINEVVRTCHKASFDAGWWSGSMNSNIPTKLCLIHSEVSEAMEGFRKDLMDDKLTHRKMIEVELADAVIRIADLAGHLGLDLGGAIFEKLEFNTIRPDHKPENRAKKGGKKF